MSTERNRVYLQHPTQEKNLLPAQLIKENEGVLSIRLLEQLLLQPNCETRQYYHDQHDLFYGFSCNVLRMESAGPQPIVSVVQTGPKERHEKRECFRVPVYDDMLTARVDEKYDAEVYDISFGGAALVIDAGSYVVEAWQKVELLFDCKTVTGRMQVRNRKKLADGRYRYGLMADPTDTPLINSLENITHELQNIKARRASRIGNNAAYANRPDYAALEAAAQAQEQKMKTAAESDQPDFQSPDGTKRRHTRKPWPGPAKAYILEDRRLRVLDIYTIDLAQGGLGFASRQYIYEGTELLLEKHTPGGTFRVCVKVTSSFLTPGGSHRVGAKFVGAPLKPGEVHPDYAMISA